MLDLLPSALASAALLGLLHALYRHRTRQMRAQRDELELLVAARTSELENANRALQEASETDALTGLRNRRYLHSRLPADLVALLRRARDPEHCHLAYGIVVVDIDHFKAINDRFGHVAGDSVLTQFAAILRSSIREGDYAVRWGGEEFLLILRDIHREQLAEIVEGLRLRIEEASFSIGYGTPIRLTTSLGCVPFPLMLSRPKSLLWHSHVELADAALYWAKHAGRNTWALCRRPEDGFPDVSDETLSGPAVELIGSGAVEIHARDGVARITGAA